MSLVSPFLNPLQIAVNCYLDYDPEVPKQLARMEGRVIELHFQQLELSLYMIISADGLDIDMALSGVVENSLFLENGNDGMDISWSPIVIRNIESANNGDKCLSVGERSTPLVYDTILRGCPIGIAVKDASHAKLERVQFETNGTAVSAYIKKPFFGEPSVSITESTFKGNREKTLALSGAVITIDSAQ